MHHGRLRIIIFLDPFAPRRTYPILPWQAPPRGTRVGGRTTCCTDRRKDSKKTLAEDAPMLLEQLNSGSKRSVCILPIFSQLQRAISRVNVFYSQLEVTPQILHNVALLDEDSHSWVCLPHQGLCTPLGSLLPR